MLCTRKAEARVGTQLIHDGLTLISSNMPIDRPIKAEEALPHRGQIPAVRAQIANGDHPGADAANQRWEEADTVSDMPATEIPGASQTGHTISSPVQHTLRNGSIRAADTLQKTMQRINRGAQERRYSAEVKDTLLGQRV